jgi:hypothetical protein
MTQQMPGGVTYDVVVAVLGADQGQTAAEGLPDRLDVYRLPGRGSARRRGGSAVADRRGPSDRLTAGALLAGRVLIGPAAA